MSSAGSRGAARAVGHDPVVVAWVEATTARQGLGVKVQDPGAIGRVAVLLRGGRGAGQSRQTGDSREGSKRLRP